MDPSRGIKLYTGVAYISMKDDIVGNGRWNLFVSVFVFEERPGRGRSLRSHEICVCGRTVRRNDAGNDAVRQENSPTPAIRHQP